MPCAVALRSKGVDCDAFCRVCGLQQETRKHILFHCAVAQAVWKNISPNILAFVLNFGDIFHWDEVFLYANDCDGLIISCYTMWILWKKIYDACFNFFSSTPTFMTERIRHLVAEALPKPSVESCLITEPDVGSFKHTLIQLLNREHRVRHLYLCCAIRQVQWSL